MLLSLVRLVTVRALKWIFEKAWRKILFLFWSYIASNIVSFPHNSLFQSTTNNKHRALARETKRKFSVLPLYLSVFFHNFYTIARYDYVLLTSDLLVYFSVLLFHSHLCTLNNKIPILFSFPMVCFLFIPFFTFWDKHFSKQNKERKKYTILYFTWKRWQIQIFLMFSYPQSIPFIY